MLQFDPFERVSPEDALMDPYFNPIKEQGYVPSTPEEHEQEMKSTFSPQSALTDSSSASSHGESLNPEKEKVRESPLHLKHNVS